MVVGQMGDTDDAGDCKAWPADSRYSQGRLSRRSNGGRRPPCRTGNYSPPVLPLPIIGPPTAFRADATGKFNYTFQTVSEPVTFYVRSGDDPDRSANAEHHRTDPASAKSSRDYTPPSYAGLPLSRIESGQLRGLERKERMSGLTLKQLHQWLSAVFAIEGDKKERSAALISPTNFFKNFNCGRTAITSSS